jgi:hypothetical protein
MFVILYQHLVMGSCQDMKRNSSNVKKQNLNSHLISPIVNALIFINVKNSGHLGILVLLFQKLNAYSR